jgi:hypothetical protein
MVQTVAHPGHLSIHVKCRTAADLVHKAVRMAVRRQACQVPVWHLTLITLKPRICLRHLRKCNPKCNLCGTINTPLQISPILCPINNGITRCKCLLNTSRHHTNLIPAHKCLMRDCPCRLEIHLPLFRVPQRPHYLTLLPLLSTHLPILLLSHILQIVLA